MALYRLFNPFVLLSGVDDGPPDDDGDDFGGGDDTIPVVGGYTVIGEDPGPGNGGNGTNSFEEWSALTGSADFDAYRSWFMGLYGDDYATANAQWALLNPDAGVLYSDF